ncbi:alpha/beta fold hydrolase [Aurantiacibacter gangjinensis]|uniref:Alpha/beta hydrolase n=1 Tax=Aurantiacibacter gangjinensis TaxID=502682 RepID=A0A0G9MR12_9SPHN|nr:alpha/beta hydrolase [Aurantiacibacter gangjinensis]APE29038.1 putative hydrolase [Aurantiacibacter gangjinensis]KLE33135.1 alpha/beta hydrolase [Aurantiacibacter gangjinensis]
MVDYREHYYTSGCGQLRLFARDYGGGGPPLLLMHGLTRNSGDFEPLAAHLSPRYRLIVPDQRGRGSSDYDPDPANYRPDVYAADMFVLLDSLSIAKPGVIGTSMGGLIAMVMNAMRPGEFPAVVFNDIGPELDPAGLARIGGYVGGPADFADWDAAAAACAKINTDAFPDFGKADWQAWARRTCREMPGGFIAFAYDPAIAQAFAESDSEPQPDLWPLWEALGDTPVLVVRGALSDLLSAGTVETMKARHSGSITFVEVPQRGHAPLLDEPLALGAITDFLAETVA